MNGMYFGFKIISSLELRSYQGLFLETSAFIPMQVDSTPKDT